MDPTLNDTIGEFYFARTTASGYLDLSIGRTPDGVKDAGLARGESRVTAVAATREGAANQ